MRGVAGKALRRLALSGLAAVSIGVCGFVAAQPVPQPVPPVEAPPVAGFSGPISLRVLNQDRLLRDSRLGQGILADLRTAEQELEAENQTISDQLAAEERELTELRGVLGPEEFRLRADEFDRRVEAIRAERSRAGQELARRYEREAQQFFQTALPVLLELMEDEGIAALIRPDALVLGVDGIDITAEAIRRIDAAQPD